MLNKISKFVLAFMAVISLQSCATVVHGTRQSIGISSNPTNANIWVDNVYLGNTPLIAQLTRKDNHFLHIEMEGYYPYDVVFTRQMSGWVLGNIIFGGIIGIAIDAVSGGIYKLTPNQVQVELCKHQVVHSKQCQDSYIAIVMEPDPSWEKIGNLAKGQ